MNLSTYTLPESEQRRYKTHGIIRIDFRYVSDVVSSLGCLINLEQLRKYSMPQHAWVKKDNSSRPCVVIASEKVKSFPAEAICLNDERVGGLVIRLGETPEGRRGILLSTIEKMP